MIGIIVEAAQPTTAAGEVLKQYTILVLQAGVFPMEVRAASGLMQRDQVIPSRHLTGIPG